MKHKQIPILDPQWKSGETNTLCQLLLEYRPLRLQSLPKFFALYQVELAKIARLHELKSAECA